MLFINADDLGFKEIITDRILDCFSNGTIFSASGMTFMNDSERAAGLAIENNIPVGLHLNLIDEFTGSAATLKLKEAHDSVASYLKKRKLNQVIYNPFLRKSFDYVFKAQWDEFYRLYGHEPSRVDGHKHFHLCMNVLISRLIPSGLKIRRNFTFQWGEKDPFNRLYRYIVDRYIMRYHQYSDFFYSMAPINPVNLARWISISKYSDVEIMVHPGRDEEYQFLKSQAWSALLR